MAAFAGKTRRLTLRTLWRNRSASMRFSLAYGVLFIFSAVLFLSFMWWGTIGLLDREVEQAVIVDARSLSERWMAGGLSELAKTIEDRLEQNVDDDAIYLLIDPTGRVFAGNLTAWPSSVTQADKWYQLPVSRPGMRGVAEIRAFPLPDGFRLLVGRDVRGRTILRRLLTDMLLWAWVMLTLLAISGTFVVRGMFRRMLRQIARTTSAIARGDLSQRMNPTGNGAELDQVATTINDMLDRISRLMDGVKQVSNSIAHDLRTPITRARNLLEDATLHARTEGELRTAIERAVANLDNVTGVFEALLRIAQIEAGARRAAFVSFDLAPLLRDICELYEALAEEKSIVLNLQIPASLNFYGDPALLQQAAANLLDNAIKFSPAGGTITFSAQEEAVPALPRGGRQMVICVTDQGIGMSADDLARASERFFRANTARDTPGSGLGLSLVQAIVTLHGGKMQLTPANPGTQASLILPVLTEQGHKVMTQASLLPHVTDRQNLVG